MAIERTPAYRFPDYRKLNTMSNDGDRYARRGVSTSKGGVHAAIAGHSAGLFPGAFCHILPDLLAEDDDHCMIMHADGAGTKSALAYLAMLGGFDLEAVWRGIAQDALVMNLDDMACVGALGPFVVSNTIGRNKALVGRDVIAAIINGYHDVTRMLAGYDIECHMAGGETADLGDLVRTIVVDCTVTTRMRRDLVIDASRIQPGDFIVGFSSTGQALWEDVPNSGMGSNGLTNARHEALDPQYRRFTETFAPETASDLIYCGSHHLDDPLPGDDRFTIGSALLSPTRTYLPLLQKLLVPLQRSGLYDNVRALIHCSGGGQTKIGKFGPDGVRYVKNGLFPTPPLFAMLQQASDLSWREMFQVFNMGHRLEAVVPSGTVDYCIQTAEEACGIDAKVVGRVEAMDKPGHEVVIESEHGTYTY